MRNPFRPPTPEPTDWRGYIAFVLALGLSAGWCTSIILSAGPRTPPIGEETATLLSTLGGAMVGAVATYLGMGRRERHPPPPEEPPDEPDGR
jgi:hypothetical protein